MIAPASVPRFPIPFKADEMPRDGSHLCPQPISFRIGVHAAMFNLVHQLRSHAVKLLGKVFPAFRGGDLPPRNADHQAENHQFGVGFHSKFSALHLGALDSMAPGVGPVESSGRAR